MRRIRQKRGFSQEGLAAEAEIDRTYVSALERGVYSASIDVIEKLATVLCVDAHKLLVPQSEESPRKKSTSS